MSRQRGLTLTIAASRNTSYGRPSRTVACARGRVRGRGTEPFDESARHRLSRLPAGVQDERVGIDLADVLMVRAIGSTWSTASRPCGMQDQDRRRGRIETAIERGAAAPTVRERAGHRVPPERPAARGGQPERPFGSSAVSRSRDRTRRRRRRRSVATRTAGRQCGMVRIVGSPGAEPGIRRDRPQGRSKWRRPAAGRKRGSEVRSDFADTHEKAAPNPGAASITSSIRPAFNISSGKAVKRPFA